jgi:hypothetical protein
MMLCALHYPTMIIRLFFFLPIPIWAFVVFQVAQDAFGLLGGGGRGGVAVDVHLAGAAFGFFYVKCHLHLTSLWPQLRQWRRRQSQPRLRVYRDEEEAPAPVSVAAAAGGDEEQLEAKMDAILEKISRTGKDSLTPHERELLLRASEVFKKKRR